MKSDKATTYPRTDCGYLPDSQKTDIDKILANLKVCNEFIDKCYRSFVSRVWNDKKVADSSHHAIIPTTNPKVNLEAMTEQERNIYQLVVKYYIAQFMGNYKYKETFIALECEDEKFSTRGIVPTSLGWKSVLGPAKEEDKDDSKELPMVEQGEMLPCKSLKILNKKTTPPSHYTDATLISAMKNCGRKVEDQEAKEMLAEVQGIGTEATRADVIETLKKRVYVAKKGKNIISTDKGREIIKQLPDELSSVIITAEWEQKLSEVAKGKYAYKRFIKEIADLTTKNVEYITSQMGNVKKFVQHPCHKCQSELIRLKSKPPKKGFYWMCSEIKNGCETFLEDNRGKPTLPKIAKVKCPSCGSDLKQRDGKKGKWWGCTSFPKCKSTFPDSRGKPVIGESNAR